jgi:hypothetical protein
MCIWNYDTGMKGIEVKVSKSCLVSPQESTRGYSSLAPRRGTARARGGVVGNPFAVTPLSSHSLTHALPQSLVLTYLTYLTSHGIVEVCGGLTASSGKELRCSELAESGRVGSEVCVSDRLCARG